MSDNTSTEAIVLPPGHFRQRIGHQYSDIPKAIVREILQNSLDAGASKIDFAFSEHSFAATDNGHGMTLADFRAFWRNLGGTKKQTKSIGGFGAAKELLSYAWESWFIRSLDFAVTGHLIDMQSEPTTGHGFEIGATDDLLDGGKTHQSLRYIMARSYRPAVTVSANGEKIPWGRQFRKPFHAFAWGNLYKVNPESRRDYEDRGTVYVRAGGLFTFDMWAGGDHTWYVEITADPTTILTESRDALRYEYGAELSKFVTAYTQEQKHEIRPKARLTVYGSVLGGESGEVTVQAPLGANLDGAVCPVSVLPAVWRRSVAIMEEDKRQTAIVDGRLRPKYARLLEAWSGVVGQVCELAGLARPLVGFYFGSTVVAMHSMAGGDHVIVVSPAKLKSASPFVVLEIAMHELAHYEYSSHGQDYESARMGIAERVGGGVLGVLANVGRALAKV